MCARLQQPLSKRGDARHRVVRLHRLVDDVEEQGLLGGGGQVRVEHRLIERAVEAVARARCEARRVREDHQGLNGGAKRGGMRATEDGGELRAQELRSLLLRARIVTKGDGAVKPREQA